MSRTVSHVTWTPPTYQQFESFFFRDFPFAGPNTPATDINYVQPQDINNAIAQGQINFSPSMFDNNGQSTTVFMYLAAFYLVENLKNASKGISAQANFPLNSIGVGGVNLGMEVPEAFKKNPTYAMFCRNAYGLQYLSFVWVHTIGGGTIVQGTTTYS